MGFAFRAPADDMVRPQSRQDGRTATGMPSASDPAGCLAYGENVFTHATSVSECPEIVPVTCQHPGPGQ